jgi:hypothetical protein
MGDGDECHQIRRWCIVMDNDRAFGMAMEKVFL